MSFLCFVQWNEKTTTSITVFVVFIVLCCVNIFTYREHTIYVAGKKEPLHVSHWYDESSFESLSQRPYLLLWLWWWIYFSLAYSPKSDWSLGVPFSTTLEFYKDQPLHFPTDFSHELYRNHSTHSNGQTLYPISFSICYPTLFLPFSESQLHHYQVGSIHLKLLSNLLILKTIYQNSISCLLQRPVK